MLKKGMVLIVYLIMMSPSAQGEDLVPIREGAFWTYEITNIGFSPICAPGEATGRIDTVTESDDGVMYSGVGECGHAYTALWRNHRYYGRYQNEWWLMLDQPEDGLVFQGFRSLMRYDLIDVIEVPAGTFQDCFQVTQLVAYQHQWTYCPGVGKVWEHHLDMSGSGYEMKLTAWDVPL